MTQTANTAIRSFSKITSSRSLAFGGSFRVLGLAVNVLIKKNISTKLKREKQYHYAFGKVFFPFWVKVVNFTYNDMKKQRM